MILELISDPLVCVSGFESVLFSMWATFTALGSFFATGGCGRHKQLKSIFFDCRTIEVRYRLRYMYYKSVNAGKLSDGILKTTVLCSSKEINELKQMKIKGIKLSGTDLLNKT